MSFSSTSSVLQIEVADNDAESIFVLDWRFKPVKYETLLTLLTPSSRLRSLLSLDQFTFCGQVMTRTILRQMLGWRDDLHPATKIELELASNVIFSLGRMQVNAVTAMPHTCIGNEDTVGIVSVDISQAGYLTRLELRFPLSK